MAGDGAVPNHDGHLDPPLADDLRQERVPEVLLLRLLRPRATAGAERAAGREQVSSVCARYPSTIMGGDLLVRDELAEDRARGDDPEPDPDAPELAAEQRDELVAEEGGEGEDDHDGDGDEPRPWRSGTMRVTREDAGRLCARSTTTMTDTHFRSHAPAGRRAFAMLSCSTTYAMRSPMMMRVRMKETGQDCQDRNHGRGIARDALRFLGFLK